ncbi:Crp/Fnr family transcriptional regulator [Sphingomonas spermidinifaciens]|uniref:Crp/Fnr family transcriptional regulator n=1 Tax=Sphingomonas spermidinifaciens TaxID=1141889 RepID=UPI0015968036|nr:Crp/Fnr family transcriptional regulator [Sphingomonas spermidinifaciens]
MSTKLMLAGRLDLAGADVLDAALARDVRTIEGGMPIFDQGERPDAIEVIVDGWAIRERVPRTGRRQIVAILCGGDVCDFNVFMMRAADSGCRVVGKARVARIGRTALNHLNRHHPAVGQALWWESMTATAIQREWSANLAMRRAEPRIAALLCMLFARMRLTSAIDAMTMPWPFTQSDLANACGLTPEHCNRSLSALRKRGLVEIKDGHVTIADPPALASYAAFDADALHCDPGLLPFASPAECDKGITPVMLTELANAE